MSATSLDPYTGRYALRTRGMTASEIRALFAVASRPEVVSLAGGSPYTAALPLDAVGALLEQLVADQGAVALNYSTGQGDPRLREQICDVMSLVGITGSPDDVVVTVGSQQALDLIARVFLDPGRRRARRGAELRRRARARSPRRRPRCCTSRWTTTA